MTPSKIRLNTKLQSLELSFPDDEQLYSLPAEYLRVFSPSAEVRGHGQPILQHGKAQVRLVGVEPVGNYALKLSFSDGHDSGLYHFDYLYQLAHEQDLRWNDYLQRLKQAGLGR